MRENKLEYKISSSGKSTFKCNANGAELLASVNDFANCVAKVMGEKPDKILYRAWMAQMNADLNGGKGYKPNKKAKSNNEIEERGHEHQRVKY